MAEKSKGKGVNENWFKPNSVIMVEKIADDGGEERGFEYSDLLFSFFFLSELFKNPNGLMRIDFSFSMGS